MLNALRNIGGGGKDKTVSSYFCRLCHFKIQFRHNLFFDTATVPLGRLILLLHSLKHWGIFTIKDNLIHLGLILPFLLLFALCETIDLIHGILWILTFPLWWIHENFL